jgi:hypothetical protein
MASEKMPKEVVVQVGTIHGFQGDECDIVFAVFNTPPSISDSQDMFLNKKNIINVAVSRARDYLFIVMPDDGTENIGNLKLVKKVEFLIHNTEKWKEFASADLEKMIFDDPQYLEKNTFSTSHQSVNVYGLPEKIYEVRTEDDAVDVQVHRREASVVPTNLLITMEDQTSTHESTWMDSYDLDESLIPSELRKDAIDIPVKGAIDGWCYLVPYEGRLNTHTAKTATAMFIPQIRNGKEKMISVSVVEEDRIIYLAMNMFKLYEQGLSDPDGIELRREFSL